MIDRNAPSRFWLPALGIAAVTTLETWHVILRQSLGLAESRAMDMIWAWSMSLAIVLWVRADARRSRYWPCFEYDVFMLGGWLFLLPQYLVRTRGAKGLLMFVGLLLLPVVMMIASIIFASALGFRTS